MVQCCKMFVKLTHWMVYREYHNQQLLRVMSHIHQVNCSAVHNCFGSICHNRWFAKDSPHGREQCKTKIQQTQKDLQLG